MQHSSDMPAKLAAGGVSCMLASFGTAALLCCSLAARSLNVLPCLPFPHATLPPLAVLNPMDVIKCRMQTQATGYRTFPQSFGKIAAEEGVRGLFKGITASMLREASYSSLRLGLYDPFKAIVAGGDSSKDDITLTQKILAGGASGAIGSAIANPTDLIKIRFQNVLPGQAPPYRHTGDAFLTIVRTEGVAGLYRGVTPTVIRASILTASQLSSYDHSKRLMLRSGHFEEHPITHVIASLVAGLVTTTTTNPVDVIKTRIMSDTAGRYSGPVDCAVQLIRTEGPAALSAFPRLSSLH